MLQSGQYGHHFRKHRNRLCESKAYASLLLVDGNRVQEQFFPNCGDGTALKFGSHKHIGLKRMQDYVCSAVQIESELVCRELVAGHPVGLESVLEFGDHLLHASSVTIAFRVYEAGPLPLEIRHVPGKSRNEVDAILLFCCPVHEVVGAEMGVSPYYYLSVFPLLAELGYQSFEQA